MGATSQNLTLHKALKEGYNLINKNLAAEEKGKGTEQNCYSSLIKHFTLLLSIYPEGIHESKREEINFLHKHA